MKKFTLVLLLTILFSSASFAQKGSSYEKAMYYLKEKGEVIFTFKANSKAQFLEINRIVSVSHKAVDENELKAEVYANKEQFQKFLTYGLPYEVTAEDNEIPQELTANRAAAAWDTTWDAYPRYSEYVAKMQYWATTYPSLCTLQSIGTTPLGRTLYVLKISDNASTDETEPEFFYTSSMHGDEITGYPTMLRFIDYLLTNYGSLSEITNLVNGTELYINPLANPDGSYKTAGNDIYNPGGATNTPTRANSNGVDLNRNYADAIGGLHDDGLAYQPETIAFLNFQATRNFVLGANYHGGTEVVNFPLDTSNTPGTGNFSYHPHDTYFKFISTEYAQLCQTADGNLNYMDAVYNTGQFPGTTNGAAWYSVYGGRQDASNYFEHNKEVTIEISDLKTPAAANLPFFWVRNRQALLNFVKQASYGLHGIVTDTQGNPIHAKVYVGGTVDNFGSWVETSPTKGDYHKVQIAGSYNVIFEAPGYVSQTIAVTLTNNATTTLNVTMVPTASVPTASDTTICTGQTASLSATGSGTIKWYSTVNATTPLASTASYTTPALTTNTSYWVESDITPANLGPASVSGTSTTNTNVANRYLIFNCTTPTKLKSVMIGATAAGQLLIELQNSSGVMLESKVVRLSASGNQDIELDFFLPAQNGLRLVSREISGTNMNRATSGITYPITNSIVTITGNSGTGTFFQFFNWKFGTVKSYRDEVIVTIKPNPTNDSVNPTSRLAGSGAFTLTVNGTNFVNGESIVRWNGSNRTTTFVSSTQLTAAINGTDVATAGTANVTVFNTCNSTTTSARTFTINANCTAPVPNIASLPTITAQCSATVTPPTATSNCYGQITGTTVSPLTYNVQGSYQIYWTYNDGNGNTSNQFQTVIISDTTAPVANVTTLPTISGQCSVNITQTPTATDNCMGTINGTTTDPLTYSAQGTYSILWTYTDNRGNQSFQSQSVIVDDTIAPIANVASLPTVTGQCSATVTAPTATDACAGTITGTTASPLTYNAQGTYNITWTYNDGNGNTSTQTQTVVVDDTIAPIANVASLPTVTGQCSATVTAPTATDACAGTITGTTNDALTYSTQGSYTVTWTYNDGNGNTSTQTQTVIVDDTIAPIANVASLPTVTGQCSATVTAPTATDACAGTITGTTNDALTYNTQGTFTVTWTYNDGNGNTSTQTQTVIVDDTIAPIANVASLPTVTGQCSATVTAPTATDACAGTITGTTNDALTYNTQGTFTVTWTYNDGNGNTSTQTQTVIVDDTIAPIANVASLPTVTGQCSATVTAPTATDACAGTITGTTNDALTYNTQGTFTVTWTYNDGNGNTSTQTQSVVVDDTIAPIANVASLPTVTGQCSATVTAPTATDACVGTITGTTTDALTYNTQGTYNITWTYNDGNGNTSTQTQSVVVDDTIAPVANVASLPTVTGQCSATVTAPTATDTCAGTITGTTTDALTYNTQGSYTVTWTYNDGNGNTSTQTQTVVVTNGGTIITFYQDIDGDTFGNPAVTTQACTQPIGYVLNNTDCDDNQIQYLDADNDGFGSTTIVACGVANNTDCNDNNNTQNVLITFYQDIDGDSFGNPSASTQACSQPVGYVLNNNDCDDNQIQYLDADNDGFGSTTIVACGVANNTDCNDNNNTQNVLITFYQDIDGDTFGNPNVSTQACSQPVGYVTNNTDCDDNQIQYLDADNDGFGSTTIVACGVANNTDCNDNNNTQNVLITFYQDIDGDTFGNPSVSTQACSQPVGYVTNNTDCDDNQIQYLDADNDGFGSTTIVACGVANNTDCNDNNNAQNVLITFYQDLDNDTFGNPNVSIQACSQPVGYVTNSTDCDDNQIQYLDADNDGFGSTTIVACGVANNTDCNDNNNTQNVLITFYQDIDGDTFGNPAVTTQACTQPIGYVLNNTDCDDNQIQYLDADNDGFGSTTIVACGVANNTDCNDNNNTQNVLITYYQDLDNDTFGNPNVSTQACSQPVGYVTNNTDCDDNQIQYLDADNDGFGSTTIVACGVANNTDCNDNNNTQNVLITFYQDIDGDSFGNPSASTQACSQPVGYVLNNNDCDDNQIQYLDADNDGFGSTTIVACGVANNTDCNDNNNTQNVLITFYQDIDGDSFGNPSASTQACSQPVGYVLNNNDCDDNQIQYLDADNDGFGSTTIVACGVANNTDCNDNNNTQNVLITFYQDNDGDTFGNPSVSTQACSQPVGYVTNNTDCDDNQIQYLDADNDGFGSTTIVACGVANNTDCNDNNNAQNVLITFYQDLDNDTFGNPSVSTQACSQPVGYVTNNTDCDDNQIQYLDADNDGFGSTTIVACGVANNTDCNDNNNAQNVLITFYQDLDNDTFGNPNVSIQACSQPVGYVTNNLDCNDNNSASNALNTYYQDLDNDGFGNPNVSTQSCSQPIGYVIFGTDCDDTRANVNPNAVDVCYDGLDNDCNGIIDNACTPIVGSLPSGTCGTTIAGWYSTVSANWTNSAQGYRFKITKVDMNTNAPIAAPVIIDRPVNNISLANVPGTTYNSRYMFEIAVRYNNVWQPFFGTPCYLNTPNPVSTIGAQCGSTLTAFNQWITANQVTAISSYKFRITQMDSNGLNPSGAAAQEITLNSNKFNMTQLSGILYNTFYKVEVALRNTDGSFLAYGSGCNIKTPAHPTTQLTSVYCNNYNVVNNYELISANLISTATSYRFRLFNGAGYDATYTSLNNKFSLNNFAGIAPGIYSVQVSVKLPNEPNFGPYGQTCTIVFPGFVSEKVIDENSFDKVEFNVSIYPNPFSDSFNIKTNTIFNKNTSISVYDLTGRQIESINLDSNELESVTIGSSYPSGVYSMIVTQGSNTKTIRIVKR